MIDAKRRVLISISDPATGLAAAESARLYSLWTEIYADRWAHHINGDLIASVAALVVHRQNRGLDFGAAVAPIVVLLLFTLVFGALAVLRFRWESDG